MSDSEYDYVIIGSGSAGSVLASRLSARAEVTVAVIEAGGFDEHRFLRIPATWWILHQSKLVDTVPSEPEPSLDGRVLTYVAGRVVGGSGTINNLVYELPTHSDFDAWATAGGAEWKFDALKLAFERVHKSLATNFVPASLPAGAFQAAAMRFAERAPGWVDVRPFRVTTEGGRRTTVADAFLKPASGRANVSVRLGARALRIVFEGRRARAVETMEGGSVGRVVARREVICCAGVFGSPKLLMLSGLGPGADLRRLGIPVVADLPGIGAGFRDHPVLLNVWHAANHAPMSAGSPLAEARVLGRLTKGGDDTRPDFMVAFAPVWAGPPPEPGPPPPGVSTLTALLTPQSRGKISLRSKDPDAKVVLSPNLLTDPSDVQRLGHAYQLARELMMSHELSAFRTTEASPASALGSPVERAAFARANAQNFQHGVGTCAMGSGPDTVVDRHLMVHGVEGLRVVDASIMPALPAAPTNATVVALADRASEFFPA